MNLGTHSIWIERAEALNLPKIIRDCSTDVCIIGAGIAGMTCAYTLAAAGKSVVVLEKGAIGRGQTSRTTAHLSNVLDDGFTTLTKQFGVEGARLAIESHAEAINLIDSIVQREAIECDFQRVDGYLFGNQSVLKDEWQAIQNLGNLPVAWAPRPPITHCDMGKCLKFTNQAQFHPLKYLYGLAVAARANGVIIYGGSEVSSIKSGESAHVKTSHGPVVKARSVIIATNPPINSRFLMPLKQETYDSYALGFTIPRDSVERALFWDTHDPYHYVRVVAAPDNSHDVLIVGGEDHLTGQCQHPDHCFDRLATWAKQTFGVDQICARWSGMVLEPCDSLAMIGHSPCYAKNTYICTGDSGHGLTHGTIAGMLIPALILEGSHPWSSLYDPTRFIARAMPEYAKHNGNVVCQYTDWLRPGEVSDVSQIKPGEGAIICKGLSKEAVYCQADGKYLCCSAVCPHLGGLVRWNSVEKSWDCPCHGSRFAPDGQVLMGPANRPLSRKDQ